MIMNTTFFKMFQNGKSLFYCLHQFIHQSSFSLIDTLVKMGMVDQLVSLLHGPHESFHEHVLNALVVLVSDNPRAVQECHRPELRLEEVVNDKILELGKQNDDAYEVCMQPVVGGRQG
jgi:hypothetical protein